nr:hypothetical protein [Tanacetum cinerariifolium]
MLENTSRMLLLLLTPHRFFNLQFVDVLLQSALLCVDDRHATVEDDLDIIDSTHSVSNSHEAIVSKSNLGKLEGAVLVNDASMKLVKQHFQVDPMTEDAQESKQDIPKSKSSKHDTKRTKKKPASIIPKSPETSAIRLLKPKAIPTPVPSVKSSSKKTISSTTSSKKKIHSVSESKRIALISSSDVTSTGPKQLPTKGSEAKASTYMTSQKENERHMLETRSQAGMGSFDINVATRPHVGDL